MILPHSFDEIPGDKKGN